MSISQPFHYSWVGLRDLLRNNYSPAQIRDRGVPIMTFQHSLDVRRDLVQDVKSAKGYPCGWIARQKTVNVTDADGKKSREHKDNYDTTNMVANQWCQNGGLAEIAKEAGIDLPTCATFEAQLQHLKIEKSTSDSINQAYLGLLPIDDIKEAFNADNPNSAVSVIANAEVAGMFAFATAHGVKPGDLALPYFKDLASLANPDAIIYDRNHRAASERRAAKLAAASSNTPVYTPPAGGANKRKAATPSTTSRKKPAQASSSKGKAAPKSKGKGTGKRGRNRLAFSDEDEEETPEPEWEGDEETDNE